MKSKKINYDNGISYLLTKSKDSYAVLANKLTKIIATYPEITERKVKEWAHGTLPYGAELEAIVRYSQKQEVDKSCQIRDWKDVFFPSPEFTLKFIQKNTLEQVKKTLETEQIDYFVSHRSLGTLYIGLENKGTSTNVLASILITKIYYELVKKDLIKSTKIKDYNFTNYKKLIQPFLCDRLKVLSKKCIFTQEAMHALKNVLVKDGTNRANIRKEALKQVIRII